eukprot:4278586-Pleurochrysis_carterae.AAC.2
MELNLNRIRGVDDEIGRILNTSPMLTQCDVQTFGLRSPIRGGAMRSGCACAQSTWWRAGACIEGERGDVQ